MKKGFLLGLSLLLTACSSTPVSYLPSGKTPIVNVESTINEKIMIEAKSEKLEMTNLTDHAFNLAYKLFWYDIEGVSQQEWQNWQTLWLNASAKHQISLIKPTEESVNYRIYVKNQQ